MEYKIGEIVNHKLIGKCIVIGVNPYKIRLKDGSIVDEVDERELEEVDTWYLLDEHAAETFVWHENIH